MRHTRNRQLKRFNKKHIIFCIGNLPIDFIREYAQEDMKLDPTFKWHREYDSHGIMPWRYNFIEFQGKLRLVKF